MKDDDNKLLAIILVLGILLGVSIGVATANWCARRKAIDAGVAEWTIDAKTGETHFVYKEPTDAK